jgi:hypothetical protein
MCGKIILQLHFIIVLCSTNGSEDGVRAEDGEKGEESIKWIVREGIVRDGRGKRDWEIRVGEE